MEYVRQRSARRRVNILYGQYPSHEHKESLSPVQMPVLRLGGGYGGSPAGLRAGRAGQERACVTGNFSFDINIGNVASRFEWPYAGERDAALSCEGLR